MKKYLFYLAVTGWILALLVHILSLADIDVKQTVPFVWLLHIGVFIVWIPVIFSLKENVEIKPMGKSMNAIGFYKIIFKETPTWMKVIAGAGFVYAFINFMLFAASPSGTPDIKDGQFILQNHGQVIRTITEYEYHHYKANVMRGFSGHWIFFYGVAIAALYKYSGLKK